MDTSSWEETGRVARRRRWVRISAVVVPLLLLVAVWQFVSVISGSDVDQSDAAAPGFRDGTRTLSTAPFEPAKPDKVGVTTIPGLGEEGDDSSTSTSPPAPTTTIAPLPNPGDDPVCAAVVKMAQILRVAPTTNGAQSVPSGLAATMREAADLVEQAGDSVYGPLILTARAIANDLDTADTVAEVQKALRPLLAPEDDGVASSLAAVYQHAQSACPGITGAIA